MVEEEEDRGKAKISPAPIKNRGLYVRMRFLHYSNNNKKQQHGNKSQPLHHLQCNSHDSIINYLILFICSNNCRCFKWFLLWFFISLYFFNFSFLFPPSDGNNSGPSFISLSKTTTFSHLISSRALSESTARSSSKSTATPLWHLQPSSSVKEGDSLNGLKIYIYELPSKYNRDWLTNDRCSNHLFASEVAIHRALVSNGRFRTLDPYEADFFFVPVYVSCNFSTANGFPAIGHARSLISSAIQHISTAFPFWNRSGGGGGSDHVFVASHDFGACFHTMEDVAVADGIAETLKGSVILQTFGVTYEHPCQHAGNSSVVIPPYIPPAQVRSTLKKFPLEGRRRRRRDIFAFFRGKMELHPKNVSGRFYSKAVRTKIWNNFNRDRRFYLRRRRYVGYQSEISRSVFCLCPLGWAPWSPRLVESVALGCVPVIIADNIRLPFSDRVPWKDISLTVPERDVEKLGQILDDVARTNLSAIQANIWGRPDVRTALLFHVPMMDGDATWQVLSELSRKLVHRSHRSSRGGLIE